MCITMPPPTPPPKPDMPSFTKELASTLSTRVARMIVKVMRTRSFQAEASRPGPGGYLSIFVGNRSPQSLRRSRMRVPPSGEDTTSRTSVALPTTSNSVPRCSPPREPPVVFPDLPLLGMDEPTPQRKEIRLRQDQVLRQKAHLQGPVHEPVVVVDVPGPPANEKRHQLPGGVDRLGPLSLHPDQSSRKDSSTGSSIMATRPPENPLL